jgi:L-lactate dehydrogenase complex protein LldG
MSGRDAILRTISLNKPANEELHLVDLADMITYPDPCQQFINMVSGVGGKVVYLDSRELLLRDLEAEVDVGNYVINGLDHESLSAYLDKSPEELEKVEKCFLRSSLGVAENGAVWLDESAIGNRLVPFICQHLVVVLSPDDIVHNMHDAYRKINYDDAGFGVFISGPSKTADIEQSLVIGAHGAKELTIYLV